MQEFIKLNKYPSVTFRTTHISDVANYHLAILTYSGPPIKSIEQYSVCLVCKSCLQTDIDRPLYRSYNYSFALSHARKLASQYRSVDLHVPCQHCLRKAI